MNEFYADRLFTALEKADPEPGMLLVSAPGMTDEFFGRSVILIIEHSEHYTLGVNLTQRSDVAIANVLPDWLSMVASPQALYIGGPVNQQAVMGLAMTKMGVRMENEATLNRLAPRLAHVDLRSTPEEMAQLVDGLRFFAGYCEWEPGQLDTEIADGTWFLAPALPGDVIMPGAADLWGDVLRRQPMPLPLYATFPKDAGEN